MAFALVAAQAGDAKCTKTAAAQDKPACCAQTKASVQTSSSCPFAKSDCCSEGKQTAAKKTAVKQALRSPKAAASL